MPATNATTPDEYIASLPDDRRAALSAVRDVVRRNLPPGYVEGMASGMIAWYVPLQTFPDTYNGQPLGLAALANQKGYMSLYLNSVYGNRAEEARFKQRFAAAGKRLDMGKSCVRFRRLDDLALDVIGETIARADLDAFLAQYAEARGSSRRTRAAKREVTSERARNVHSVVGSVETRMRPERGGPSIGRVTLTEWLEEYRSLAPDSVVREVAEPEDDWEEPELIASPDRLRDTTPRWRVRAERVGYGRVTSF